MPFKRTAILDGQCTSSWKKIRLDDNENNAQANTSTHESNYKMTHSKRGRAIILNHIYCIGHDDPRRGTHQDVKRLERTFGKIWNFQVIIYTDLTYEEIIEKFYHLSQDSFDDEDCLVIIVLTHGTLDKLVAKDKIYSIYDLWHHFTSKNCKSLINKPKLFFINSCRGDKFDKGVLYNGIKKELKTDVSSTEEIKENCVTMKMPNDKDFLLCYSTMPGFISIRQICGTWFIQCLCETIEEEDNRNLEILDILTKVQRKTALKCNSTNQPICQMPCIMSTLTRNVYFK